MWQRYYSVRTQVWPQIARLAKQSVIYGAANAGVGLLALLLVPLYTYNLTSSEFGAYALVMMAYGVLSVVADCGLTNGIARYYFNESEGIGIEDRRTTSYQKNLVATGVAASAVISIMVSVPLYVLAEVISRQMFSVDTYGALLRIVAVTIMFQALTTTPMVYLRLRERAVSYALLTVLQMGLLVALNTLFVVVFRWGVSGILYGQLWSTAVWAVLCIAAVGGDLKGMPSGRIAKDLLGFGLPFMPVLLLFWVIDFSDRYLVERYVSTAQLGLYSLGYKLGQVMTLVVTAFTLGWASIRFKILSQKDARTIYARVAALYLAVAGGVWLSIALFAREMVMLFSPREFHDSAVYIAPVALGYLLYGLYVVSLTGLGVMKRTWSQPWVALLGALANIGLNLWLIPQFGAIVAAYTTVVAYGVLTGASLFVSQRAYAIPYNYVHWLWLLGAMIVLSQIPSVLPSTSWFLSLGTRLGIVVVYVTVILGSGVITREELSSLVEVFLNRRLRSIATTAAGSARE
jgi:O-antigen/teichoic acid export membrane protein